MLFVCDRPGTYDPELGKHSYVQYHQSFGGNPIDVPSVKQHSTIDKNTNKVTPYVHETFLNMYYHNLDWQFWNVLLMSPIGMLLSVRCYCQIIILCLLVTGELELAETVNKQLGYIFEHQNVF